MGAAANGARAELRAQYVEGAAYRELLSRSLKSITFATDLEPIFQVLSRRLQNVEHKLKTIRRFIGYLDEFVRILLNRFSILDFLQDIIMIQRPWHLRHGAHPPREANCHSLSLRLGVPA